MKPFSILHISDLHRSPGDPISNDELISALVSDRDRYIKEDPCIAAPEAIVVSGDIIQGVPLGTANFSDVIAAQYAVAEEFLDELVRRFLDGDRARLVLVPGNHDVDWNTAIGAFQEVPDSGVPQNLPAALHTDDSDFRWDWKSRKLYRIIDRTRYDQRLEAFWMFFEKFYDGVSGLLNVRPRTDCSLFALCDERIGVAAFNSCHGNDCYAYHGMIRRDVVARSHLDLNDTGKVFDLRMAVWHHSIDGPPYRTDYMDVDIVRGMIGRGYRLGLYGHQHKTHVAPHEVWLPDRERMAVVSAGSLCAGAAELPTGYYRQYNILEIGNDFQSVHVHVRAMAVANIFSRGRLMDFGDKSFAELNWHRPKTPVGSRIDTNAKRINALIEEAEVAAMSGKAAEAVALLLSLELAPGSYQRQLCLTAAADAEDWETIVRVADPPVTIDELVQRFEAFMRMGNTDGASDSLDRFSEQLQLPAPMVEELRRRISAKKVMKK
jgi:3',5'-cyclic AMP phosphodiesterase CpdA